METPSTQKRDREKENPFLPSILLRSSLYYLDLDFLLDAVLSPFLKAKSNPLNTASQPHKTHNDNPSKWLFLYHVYTYDPLISLMSIPLNPFVQKFSGLSCHLMPPVKPCPKITLCFESQQVHFPIAAYSH